ncbi:MAG: hypothetical protein QNK82_16225, partial [Akkermansiaceae bacterium]
LQPVIWISAGGPPLFSVMKGTFDNLIPENEASFPISALSQVMIHRSHHDTQSWWLYFGIRMCFLLNGFLLL